MRGVKERIKNMTRDEKWAEFKSYADNGGLFGLDIDRVKADQAIMGAPDAALDTALLRIAVLAGAILGREPVTAQEFADSLEGKGELCRLFRSHRRRMGEEEVGPGEGVGIPEFSMRLSRRR